MVEEAEQSLIGEEKGQLFVLLLQYHTAFAIGDGDLGCTTRVQHNINSLCGVCHNYGTRKLRSCLMTCSGEQ